MKVLGFVWLACVPICLAADDATKSTNAEKIVGKWEISKTGTEGAPVGAVVEFQKNGKRILSLKISDKELTFTGTYKVEKDRLTVTLKTLDGKEESETNTIKTLNDTTLVLIEKDKKETEFKKQKQVFRRPADDVTKSTNAEKIIGKWEVTKTEAAEGVPVGTIVEFQKDGKVTLSLKIQEASIALTGTYKVEKDKLTITMKGPDGKEVSETDTIKILNDTTLVLIEKDKKETEFKKKK